MPTYRIRAVVFRAQEHWVAQCLEYSYAIQTRRLEDMPGQLRQCLTLQILLSHERGIEPFHGFKPAPKRYWEMYERALPLAEPAEGESEPEIELRLAA